MKIISIISAYRIGPGVPWALCPTFGVSWCWRRA